MMSATTWNIGDVVQYVDMANPASTFIVVEVNDNPWNTYGLRSVEAPFEMEYTDGRQHGWEVLA